LIADLLPGYEMDSVLVPYLKSVGREDSEHLLGLLVAEKAEPIIRKIIRAKLSSKVYGRGEPSEEQDIQDIVSEVMLQVLRRLQELKSDPENKAISNFNSYVAVTTYNACHEYLRQKYPQRWRIKNKIRYLASHSSEFALWQSREGEWICGHASDSGKMAVTPVEISEINIYTEPKVTAKGLTRVLNTLFERSGGPLELDGIVSIVCTLLGIKEHLRVVEQDQKSSGPDQLTAYGTDVYLELDQKDHLSFIWREIAELPLKQRSALLLSLRDDQGRTVLTLLPITGIASIREIARILELEAEKLAELWRELPLTDAYIAQMLSLTRQQVINLRKAARKRLTRKVRNL
jgi:RNA polymerase sigma factor (sigma-70 family)